MASGSKSQQVQWWILLIKKTDSAIRRDNDQRKAVKYTSMEYGVPFMSKFLYFPRYHRKNSITRVNRSANLKVWRASRDADVKNHDVGGVITQLCKGHEIADAILHTQNKWHRNLGL